MDNFLLICTLDSTSSTFTGNIDWVISGSCSIIEFACERTSAVSVAPARDAATAYFLNKTKMSKRNWRSVSASSSSSCSSFSSCKRRPVQRRTVEKWIAENDRELNTSLWLKFEMADREHVSLLKCSVCSEFMRNFKAAFIDGSANIRLSSVKDWWKLFSCVDASKWVECVESH